MVSPLQKIIWQFLENLTIELDDPAIPFLGIYPRELKAGTQTSAFTPMIMAALFTITKT